MEMIGQALSLMGREKTRIQPTRLWSSLGMRSFGGADWVDAGCKRVEVAVDPIVEFWWEGCEGSKIWGFCHIEDLPSCQG